jgi:hypothetical protein
VILAILAVSIILLCAASVSAAGNTPDPKTATIRCPGQSPKDKKSGALFGAPLV